MRRKKERKKEKEKRRKEGREGGRKGRKESLCFHDVYVVKGEDKKESMC